MKVSICYEDGTIFSTITPQDVKEDMEDTAREHDLSLDQYPTEQEIWDEFEDWVTTDMRTCKKNEKDPNNPHYNPDWYKGAAE